MKHISVVCLMCFCINLINVCNATVSKDEVDVDVYYDDSEIDSMSEKDKFNLHHAFVAEKLKWKYATISFKIDKAFSDDELVIILLAMYEIERSSCIRFADHDPSHGPNYVMIKKTNEKMCATDVGCQNKGEQFMILGAGCMHLNIVIHEMLHAIGFDHHQSRSDNAKYIDINRNNILTEAQHNFQQNIKYDARMKYVTPFDYESIMLYDEYVFSKNNKTVITSKDKRVKIRPSKHGLTVYDKILLNRFYSCKSLYKKRSKIFYETENGITNPPVINYHVVQRAREYELDDEGLQEEENATYYYPDNEENLETDEKNEEYENEEDVELLRDPQLVNEEELKQDRV